MTHGWPGSVVELLETVGPLTDPTAHGGDAGDAFHLVLPSLPGYGFSAEPAELGWDAARTGRAWAELMHRLGYDRYVAQGGDVGALVTDLMGRQVRRGPGRLPPEPAHGGARNRRSPAQGVRTGTRCGRGVRDVQGRRFRLLPRDGDAAADDRLRHARFTGRPGGLAARSRHGQLLQDLRAPSSTANPSGNLTRETIVDNITLYWLTGTGASAARSYWEDARALAASLASGQPPPPVTVPVGFTTFPGEIWASPRSWVEAVYPDLAYFNEAEKGGHFAAWEEPELFVGEVRAAFRMLR